MKLKFIFPLVLLLTGCASTANRRPSNTAPASDPVISIPQIAQVGKHGSAVITPRTGYKSFDTTNLRKTLPETSTCFYGDTVNIEAGLALIASLQNNRNIPSDGVPAILQSLYASKQIFQMYTRTLLWGDEDGGCEKYFFALVLNGDYRLIQINYIPDDPDAP